MEYQIIINLLDNTPNESSKFRKKIGLKKMITHVEHITTKISNIIYDYHVKVKFM